MLLMNDEREEEIHVRRIFHICEVRMTILTVSIVVPVVLACGIGAIAGLMNYLHFHTNVKVIGRV